MNIKDRFNIAFKNETGAGILEAVVLIAVFMVISYYLMNFLGQILEFGKTRTGYSTTTGWFRNDNTTGIKN